MQSLSLASKNNRTQRINGTVSYLNPDAEYGFVLPIGWTYDDAKFFRKDVLPSLWAHLQVGSSVSFELTEKPNSSARHRAMKLAHVDAEVPVGAEEYGRIKSFDKGIGFIVPENELIATLIGDVFFHKNAVETSLAGITIGVEVTFRLSASKSKAGKFEALAVRASSKQSSATSSLSATARSTSTRAALVPPPVLFPEPSSSKPLTTTNTAPSKSYAQGTGKDAWDDEDDDGGKQEGQRPAVAVAHNSAHSFLVYQDAIEGFVEIVSGWGANLVGAPLHHSVTPLPSTFSDITHYFSSFLPLLFEDVRAQMHSTLERSKKTTTQTKVMSLGWKGTPANRETEGKLLLSVSTNASTSSIHFLDCCLISQQNSFTHLGIVQRTDKDAIEFRVRIAKHDPNALTLPEVGSQVDVTPLMSLASAQRVYGALRASVAPAHLAPMLIDPNRIPSLNKTRAWDELPDKMEERINREFNSSQQEVLRAFAALHEGILLVQGPPGTGKTSTILGLVGVALHQNSRVLICSPSNTAVDELVIRISQRGVLSNDGHNSYRPELTLLGNHEKIDTSHESDLDRALLQTRREKLLHLLQNSISGSSSEEGTKRALITAEKFESELRSHFHERHFRKWSSALKLASGNFDQSLPLIQSMIDRLIQKSDDFDLEMLNASEIVCCTLSASGRSIMRRAELIGFDVVLVDEAAQGTEAETLVPLREHCKRIVLVGDPAQLPATVTSEVAQRAHYDRSMQARIMSLLDANREMSKSVLLMLRTQYRMHPLIRQWPSAHFYHNLLDDAPAVKNQKPVNAKLGNLIFFDCESGVEERDPYSLSILNRTEAAVVLDVLNEIFASDSTLDPSQVGVITFYAAQAFLLRQQIRNNNSSSSQKVQIATVDSFQGKEKEVIILSFVRSNVQSTVGFLKDMRRLNVALTRAKRSLVLIGHAQTLATHPDLKSMIEFLRAEKRLILTTTTATANVK